MRFGVLYHGTSRRLHDGNCRDGIFRYPVIAGMAPDSINLTPSADSAFGDALRKGGYIDPVLKRLEEQRNRERAVASESEGLERAPELPPVNYSGPGWVGDMALLVVDASKTTGPNCQSLSSNHYIIVDIECANFMLSPETVQRIADAKAKLLGG